MHNSGLWAQSPLLRNIPFGPINQWASSLNRSNHTHACFPAFPNPKKCHTALRILILLFRQSVFWHSPTAENTTMAPLCHSKLIATIFSAAHTRPAARQMYPGRDPYGGQGLTLCSLLSLATDSTPLTPKFPCISWCHFCSIKRQPSFLD